MPLPRLTKENLVLVIGLSLPVLLVVLFFAASVLPKLMTPPPQYPLYFTVESYRPLGVTDKYAIYGVDKGALVATIRTRQKDTYAPRMALIVYDGKTNSARDISLQPSAIDNAPDNSKIVIEETKNVKLDTSNKAPDGYSLERETSGYHSRGLVVDLFGGGDYNLHPRIVKGNAAYKVRIVEDSRISYYGGFSFLGWGIPQ